MAAERARPLNALFIEDNVDGTVGGSHVCLRNLVLHLDPAVVRPVALFYQANRIADELRAAGVETHIWEEQYQKEMLAPNGGLRAPRLLGQFLAAIARRVRFLKANRIDVVHLNNSPGSGFSDWLPACKVLGRPCLAHARGYHPEPNRWIWSYLQHNFDHYIPMSVTVQDSLRQMGYDMRRTTVVFDAIDEANILGRVRRPADDVRRELGLRGNQVLAVMAGHVRPWKGQAEVLRGVAALNENERDRLVLAFAGGVARDSEDYYAQLVKYVADQGLGGSIRFLGERTDVPDLMNAADLILHASTTPEPFGLVVLEGMLFGKLVLASRRGGPTEMIRPGTGILFDPDDPQELARELARGIVDESNRKAMGEAARVRAREFGPISRTARGVEAVYNIPHVRRKLA